MRCPPRQTATKKEWAKEECEQQSRLGAGQVMAPIAQAEKKNVQRFSRNVVFAGINKTKEYFLEMLLAEINKTKEYFLKMLFLQKLIKRKNIF